MASHQLAQRSVTGRRPANQDVVLVRVIDLAGDETATLLVVADGMGGASSGDVASRTAAEAFTEIVVRQLEGSIPTDSTVAQTMRDGYTGAHDSVVREAKQDPGKKGMGTTLVSALIIGDRFVVGNVGDSRAYLIDSGDITQITKDHTARQEMIDRGVLPPRASDAAIGSHALTRVIGDPDDQAQVDLFPANGRFDLFDGHILLLCSDGLCNGIDDDEIHDIICATESVDTAAEALVRAAWHGGSKDNVSVLLVESGRLQRRTHFIDLLPAIPVANDASPKPQGRRLAGLATGLALLAVALGYASYKTWKIDTGSRAHSEGFGSFPLPSEFDTVGAETARVRAESVLSFPQEPLHGDTVSVLAKQQGSEQQTGADRSP